MLNALEQYYKKQCDGKWEHNFGFTIESCDNPGWMMNIKDPHLYRIVCSIAEKRENPDSVNICLGAAEFSEVILFSRQLQTLGHFVKNLLADNQDY